MADDLPPDDLLGKKVFHDGHEWTVRYNPATRRVGLERPLEAGFEVLLKVLREGTATLQNDPAELAGQPLPTKREAAVQEWLMIDAAVAGARQHGTLEPGAIELLECRLAQLTGFLSASSGGA